MPNDLIPAGVDTQSPQALRVGEPEKFDLKTPAAPVLDTGIEKHYMCSMPFASMARKDGIRIGFIHGHFSSKMKADQDYLDKEIADGHSSIRHATPEEARNAMLIRDPIGTLRKEIRAEVTVDEEVLRQKLLKEIEAAGGVIPSSIKEKVKEPVVKKELPSNNLPGEKNAALAALRDKIKSGSGTLNIVGAQGQVPGNGASTLNPTHSGDISEGADG